MKATIMWLFLALREALLTQKTEQTRQFITQIDVMLENFCNANGIIASAYSVDEKIDLLQVE